MREFFLGLSMIFRKLQRSVCTAMFVLASAAVAETPGKDGDLTISAPVSVNTYAPLVGSPAAGSTSITADNLAINIPDLAAGDVIMIYQAQGATIDTSDSVSYGTVTDYGSAGRYEFQTVASVSGNIITLAGYNGNCSGLRFDYAGIGNPQIVRVPQYRNLTITAAGSITAAVWNGTTGGVVALLVSGNLSHNGVISASGAGFRGGAIDNTSVSSGSTTAIYRSTLPADGAEKGESIAGPATSFATGAYGRGAPANGGGGGNGHNAGGGGGANGNNGNVWAGQGVPNTSTADWITAWNLDPTLNASTNNSGGGRGGYTFGSKNVSPLTTAPGDAAWGGNLRRELGGLGGRPLAYDRTGRIFFGGGGGAGDGNNNAAAPGASGGGIVFILANSIAGSGTILANGANATNTLPNHNDAPGGGGGGGTIIIRSTSLSSVQLVADGGTGGTQLIINNESEGPGGGGGGGVIASVVLPSVAFARGGANGLSNSASVTLFKPNGATSGATGQPSATAPSGSELPFCFAPTTAVQISKSEELFETSGINAFHVPGADVIYAITVTNPAGQIDAGSLFVTDVLSTDLIFYNGDMDDTGPATGPVYFIEGSTPSSLICCTSAHIAYSAFTTGADFTYVPVAGYDPLVKRLRVTPAGSMSQAFSTPTSFQLRFRARIK
jgi:uncharacterized repeat protein (TIGR01451 family)